MKRVDKHAEFEEALASAQREGKNSFGDARVLIEKYVTAPRHVEIQVFGDSHGNVVHLFERDCSAQRRHQKVIEEAPAPGMTDEVRAAMGKAAVDAAKAVGYVGAGTVEFIADGSRGLRKDGFYFMEMNTRLQVEHPVTEMITGLDLVELQLRVAAGEPLGFAQGDLRINGHAVEARVYAEDPEHDFLPSTGKLWALRLPEETAVRPASAFPSPLEGEGGRRMPTGSGWAQDNPESTPSRHAPHATLPLDGGGKIPGIRVDSGVAEGGSVTPHYDPMIAKVIAHGATRDEALDRLSAALTRTIVAGPKSNVRFLRLLADHPDFRAGKLDTGLIGREKVALGAVEQPVDAEAVLRATAALVFDDFERLSHVRFGQTVQSIHICSDPWAVMDRSGFQIGPRRIDRLKVVADGMELAATISYGADGPNLSIADHSCVVDYKSLDLKFADADMPKADSGTRLVIRNNRQTRVSLFDSFDVDLDATDESGGAAIKSPMHGKLVALMVKPGDAVARGQTLAIVEAMKMEHALAAPRDGVVAEVIGEVGAQVGEGARVVVLKEA
jgi:3-methylcrotonyl-CoA carboxylase alpha subunit